MASARSAPIVVCADEDEASVAAAPGLPAVAGEAAARIFCALAAARGMEARMLRFGERTSAQRDAGAAGGIAAHASGGAIGVLGREQASMGRRCATTFGRTLIAADDEEELRARAGAARSLWLLLEPDRIGADTLDRMRDWSLAHDIPLGYLYAPDRAAAELQYAKSAFIGLHRRDARSARVVSCGGKGPPARWSGVGLETVVTAADTGPAWDEPVDWLLTLAHSDGFDAGVGNRVLCARASKGYRPPAGPTMLPCGYGGSCTRLYGRAESVLLDPQSVRAELFVLLSCTAFLALPSADMAATLAHQLLTSAECGWFVTCNRLTSSADTHLFGLYHGLALGRPLGAALLDAMRSMRRHSAQPPALIGFFDPAFRYRALSVELVPDAAGGAGHRVRAAGPRTRHVALDGIGERVLVDDTRVAMGAVRLTHFEAAGRAYLGIVPARDVVEDIDLSLSPAPPATHEGGSEAFAFVQRFIRAVRPAAGGDAALLGLADDCAAEVDALETELDVSRRALPLEIASRRAWQRQRLAARATRVAAALAHLGARVVLDQGFPLHVWTPWFDQQPDEPRSACRACGALRYHTRHLQRATPSYQRAVVHCPTCAVSEDASPGALLDVTLEADGSTALRVHLQNRAPVTRYLALSALVTGCGERGRVWPAPQAVQLAPGATATHVCHPAAPAELPMGRYAGVVALGLEGDLAFYRRPIFVTADSAAGRLPP